MAFVLPGQDSSLWAAADMNVGCLAVPRLLVVDTDSLNPNIFSVMTKCAFVVLPGFVTLLLNTLLSLLSNKSS